MNHISAGYEFANLVKVKLARLGARTLYLLARIITFVIVLLHQERDRMSIL